MLTEQKAEQIMGDLPEPLAGEEPQDWMRRLIPEMGRQADLSVRAIYQTGIDQCLNRGESAAMAMSVGFACAYYLLKAREGDAEDQPRAAELTGAVWRAMDVGENVTQIVEDAMRSYRRDKGA